MDLLKRILKILNMDKIFHIIKNALLAQAYEKTKQSSLRFFKEEVKLYGVKSALVETISNDVFKEIKGRDKSDVFELCDMLWLSGYLEESFIACHLSYYLRKEFQPRDFILFEKWVSLYINNWASCDTFCNHTVGSFIEMNPGFIANLKEWTKSDNRWMRRAAAVSLIIPARKGLFLKEIFEIANLLLTDSDDMVQKGYGWMLKVASKVHQKDIFDFVMKNKSKMPRTALRYSIEKMPTNLRVLALQK